MSETPQEVAKNDQISPYSSASMLPSTPRPLAFNRKAKEYKAFIKLIRLGKVASAVIMAKSLGVNPDTIKAWKKTPAAITAIRESVNVLVSGIEGSKDWKAKAYLIEEIKRDSDKQLSPGTVQNIQIINKDGEFSITAT